jgi:ubiquinone/menaquinone biosynthesis C-methylase UbiE
MNTPGTMAPDQIRNAWDRIAVDFDRFATPLHIRLSEDALDRVGLRRGMRFLDVAAGSGSLSIPAARLGARVVATDIAPTMIERLAARARGEGLSNLEARVMDGHALDLEDDSFDVSGSQFGIMLFPDLPRGLRELVRVTRPAGRAMMITFGPPETVEFMGFFLAAVTAVVPGFTGLPTDPPPLPFQVADREVLRRKLADAGLKNIRVDTVDHDMEIRSGKHLWDLVTHSNPIGAQMVAGLTPEQRTTVHQVLDGMLRERSGGRTAILHNEVNIAIGTK